MGDDYGGWAAFEATREHEERSEQQISDKRSLRQLRRQIFVPGAGRFFEEAAYDSWRQQQDARLLPTVAELRTEGYMLKHFAKLETEAKDAADCIRGVLLTGPEQLVSHVLGNHAFWAVAENARRLDEVEEADVAELPKKPKSLLECLEQRRKKRLAAERAKRDKPFEHLQRIPPLPVPGEALEFRVLSSQAEVREAASRLKNCAAKYIPQVVAQKCALVGLFRNQEEGEGDTTSKILAMGQLFAAVSDDTIVTSWGQRVQNCNKTLTSSQDQHFEWALENLSKLWTEAVQDELDQVLPRQASGERVIKNPADRSQLRLSFLGRLVGLREFSRILSREGYTPEWKSLAQAFVQCGLARVRDQGIIADEIIGSCLAVAGIARDSNLLRVIMGWKMPSKIKEAVSQVQKVLDKAGGRGASLTTKQWADFWFLDVPMDPSIVADEMCRMLRDVPKEAASKRMKLVASLTEPLLSNAESGDAALFDSIVSRLLRSGLTEADTKEVLKQACRLGKDAKLMVLLSKLPFPRSDLVASLTEPWLSNAESGDAALFDSIVSRLLRSGLTEADTKGVLKQACRLGKDAKLMVLLSKLPFPRSDLVASLTEPLLSNAESGDAALFDSIVSRLLRSGLTEADTKEVLKQACRLGKDAKLMVLLSKLPFPHSDLVIVAALTEPLLLMTAVLKQALQLDNDAKLTVLLSKLPFGASQLLEALTEPLLFAATACNVGLADSIVARLLQAGVTADHVSSILEAACKLKMRAKLVVLLSPLPFRSADLVDALRDPLLSAVRKGAVKVVHSIVRGLLRANVVAPQTSGLLEEAVKLTASLRLTLLLFDLPFVASASLFEALARALLFFTKQQGAKARVVVCYGFIVHSTLPFEPKVLVWSLAEAYLHELVEETDSENEFAGCGYCPASDIELALSPAGANQVAFLACLLLLAVDTLPPDAPVIRSLLDRLVNIGITTPVAEFLMEDIRPELRTHELRTLLSRSGMPC
ncbi:unnamed protein product [Symbiodinium sp. CCMP2592]|nr:unnamed protein product [Symbiodinium sp. CCMP2592]